MPIWPIWSNFEVNGLDWQCCLAGSSKTAPRIFIFSIVLGAKYSFYVKSIATYAPTFFVCNNSVLAIVMSVQELIFTTKEKILLTDHFCLVLSLVFPQIFSTNLIFRQQKILLTVRIVMLNSGH